MTAKLTPVSKNLIKRYEADLARATTEDQKDQIYRSIFLLKCRGHAVSTATLAMADIRGFVWKDLQ